MKTFCFVVVCFVVAWTLDAADMATVELGDQPNHLHPVSPYRFNREYHALIERRLLVTEAHFGRMIDRPSFEGESAVSVYADDPGARHPSRAKRFRMTLMEAQSNLWYAMPGNRGKRRSRLVPVIRHDVEIDRELAVAVQRAWAAMLFQTRYPRFGYKGLDGWTAEFSVGVFGMDGAMHGEVWCPEAGLPGAMYALGRKLGAFCKADAKNRPTLRTELLTELESLRVAAEKAESSEPPLPSP